MWLSHFMNIIMLFSPMITYVFIRAFLTFVIFKLFCSFMTWTITAWMTGARLPFSDFTLARETHTSLPFFLFYIISCKIWCLLLQLNLFNILPASFCSVLRVKKKSLVFTYALSKRTLSCLLNFFLLCFSFCIFSLSLLFL